MSDPRVSQFGHPAPAWMVSYSDLMTEIVCFFVVLYALSAVLNKEVQQSRQDVQSVMQTQHISGDVKVSKDGLSVTLEEKGEKAFFESGSAQMSPQLISILAKVAPAIVGLAKHGHDILVEGHTDNIPIHTSEFSSNWELSTARATSVVQFLIKHYGFPAKHMGAVGYGEFKPLVPNDTDEDRATNRRVVFFVKNVSDEKEAQAQKEAEKDDAGAAGSTSAEVSSDDAPAASSDAAAPTANDSSGNEPSTDANLPLPKEAPETQPGQTD